MKPTCIAYTNTNEYNIQTCGFHQTLKNKLYSDEKQNFQIFNMLIRFWIVEGVFLLLRFEQNKVEGMMSFHQNIIYFFKV